MGVDDTIMQVPATFQGAWAATIATTASSLTELVDVVIPEFDQKQRWGPCRWMARGDLTTFPARGDAALVIFDNNRNLWIIAWWPF